MTNFYFDDTEVSYISTHTLTWSVTDPLSYRHAHFDISTHTLTWSVTSVFCVLWRILLISTHTLTWSVTMNMQNGL